MTEQMGNKTMISDVELRRLVTELKDGRPDICIRYRLIGEMWKPNFLRIIQVNENGAVLLDESKNALSFLCDLSSVMQFEIDAVFQNYQPHFHYEVQPMMKEFY
jgi:hypothetical protein